MKPYYEIIDHPELLRDPYSKGLVLRDKSVLKREQSRKKAQINMDNLRKDVDELKIKIDDIHMMLAQLLTKKENNGN